MNNNLYLEALRAFYSAQKLEAKANISLYLNNAVGVGEHSDILTELKKWTGVLADAESNLETLDNNFPN